MNSIIEELYLGSIRPEELFNPNDPEYQLLNKKIHNSMEAFKEKSSDNDFKLLEELLDLYGKSNSLHSITSFINGYKIGTLMMIEVFTTKEELVQEIK
jgi:hypothetical protein